MRAESNIKSNIIDNGDDNGETFMAINLAHEVAHTLGLKEIYEDSYGDDAAEGSQTQHSSISNWSFRCIMKYYNGYHPTTLYNGVLAEEELGLCTYCRQKLHSEIPDDVYES